MRQSLLEDNIGIDIDAVERKYEKALNDFFNHHEEKALYEISNLGKQLVVSRHGPDILLEVHTKSLKNIVDKFDPVTISRLVVNANEVLLSGIMAYAMNYYSYLDVLENERAKLEKVKLQLQEQAESLEDANRRLTEIDKLKSLFIASMSHELRNPLNSVIGFSTILLEEWTGPLNDEQKENMQIVLRAGRHLLSLINDIIDISKVEAGKLDITPERLDLREIINEAVYSLMPEALKKGIELSWEAPAVTIISDKKRLTQCLLNLISNSVKFTQAGSVKVRGELLEQKVRIAVADTGIGISEEDQEKLFIPFVRLDSPMKEKVQGTGLGLYLTQKLVTEVLGGEMTLDSALGKGTTFYITLPQKINRPEKIRDGEKDPAC